MASPWFQCIELLHNFHFYTLDIGTSKWSVIKSSLGFQTSAKKLFFALYTGSDAVYQPTTRPVLSVVPSWTANMYLQIIWIFYSIFPV